MKTFLIALVLMLAGAFSPQAASAQSTARCLCLVPSGVALTIAAKLDLFSNPPDVDSVCVCGLGDFDGSNIPSGSAYCSFAPFQSPGVCELIATNGSTTCNCVPATAGEGTNKRKKIKVCQ